MIDSLDILLGTGGDTPGLEAYGAISERCEKLLSLPKDQSVYVVGVSPGGNIIAAGTKSGDVYWLAHRQADPENQSDSVLHLDHGAPILSLCFVDTSTLAVADTLGRCLLWQLGADTQPMELPTGRRVICTLFQPDSMHLAGLSLCGKLLIWNLPENKLVRALEVPIPPNDLIALVRPVHWKAAGIWVWPGQHGAVVFFNWRRNEVHTLCAHTDNVYVSLVCNDELLTISKEGTLKRWRAGSNEPVGSYEAPKGVISAAIWGEQQLQMVLINDSGKAGIYSWDGNRFNFITWLSDHGYRVAAGPDAEQFNSALRRQRMMQANDLAARAKDKIGQHAWAELAPFYQQLDELGFGHVTWGLRGQEARVKNDMVAELTAYHELFQIIPPERSESRSFLARYAELLEIAWQVGMAERSYQYLSEMDPGNDNFTLAARRLSKYAKITDSGMYVVETDTPLSLLVSSATVLSEAFVGRYLVKSIEPPFNCLAHISASEFIERYERIRKTKAQLHLPRARQAELWYVSKQKADGVTTVLFENENPDSINCLEYGITFINAGLQTIVKRITLFNAGQKKNNVSVEQHNRILNEHLQSIENNSWSNNGWLQIVDHNVTHVIRQLMTKRLAQQLRESGGNHDYRLYRKNHTRTTAGRQVP